MILGNIIYKYRKGGNSNNNEKIPSTDEKADISTINTNIGENKEYFTEITDNEDDFTENLEDSKETITNNNLNNNNCDNFTINNINFFYPKSFMIDD